jgi:septal ring factor EnvC (AmiA/AmiB activator)
VSRASSLLLLAVVVAARGARSDEPRPPEALAADRVAAESELHDLERRARALDEQAAERKARLKQRVRALYKLADGGLLRAAADSDGSLGVATREAALRRVLARDLVELAALRDESTQLDAEETRRTEALARTLTVEDLSRAPDAPPRLAGRLKRPVAGAVIGPFGPYRDARLAIELSRRGVELGARAGEPVRAAAAGEVRWVGELPGYGLGLAVDHGGGYVTLIGRLRRITVVRGAHVAAGAPVAEAAGPSVYLELAQAGTPFDPAPWLERPRQ